LMGCSTGGTNALQLSALEPEMVNGIILLSPNIELYDPAAWILNNHWGKQVAEMVLGSSYREIKDDTREKFRQYWNSRYRVESLVQLEEMLETSMKTSTFEKVKQPLLLLYYYRDDDNQDKVVKVSAMLKMFESLGTAAASKREIAMLKTGNHVIGSPFKSKDAEGVQKEVEKFMEETMGLKKQ